MNASTSPIHVWPLNCREPRGGRLHSAADFADLVHPIRNADREMLFLATLTHEDELMTIPSASFFWAGRGVPHRLSFRFFVTLLLKAPSIVRLFLDFGALAIACSSSASGISYWPGE